MEESKKPNSPAKDREDEKEDVKRDEGAGIVSEVA